MAEPAPALIAWVERVLGAPVDSVRGLRDGGMPWRFAVGDRAVVLRTGSADDVETMRIEWAGMQFAAAHGVPAPAVVAADLAHDPPLLLIEAISGTSTIPTAIPVTRLRALGAAAARLHAIAVPSDAGLPRRTRSITGVDFAVLRAEAPRQELLVRGEQVVGECRPVQQPEGLVHGDLWQGNALWDGDRLLALIDWDCAGYGPAGVDLGSLRCDAATSFGTHAADEVLRGWEDAAGRRADDLAYWDVVAALSTPPQMGWFVGAIAGQGRDDLSQALLIERRDAFLAAALEQFPRGSQEP